MMKRHSVVAVLSATGLAFALSGCIGEGQVEEGPEPSGSTSAGSDECFIELFDGDNFDKNDDHYKLTEPDEYPNLDQLPGANKNWTGEADSFRLGDDATVTMWKETDFQGDKMTVQPSTEVPDAEFEPSSLEMICQ